MGQRGNVTPDYNLLRLALAEQQGNATPGRTPSALALNAYLGSMPLTNEQTREQDTLDTIDADWAASKAGNRKRQNTIEDAHTAATLSDFANRTGHGRFTPVGTEQGGVLKLRPISPLDANGNIVRRASDSNTAPTDPDAAMSARERAMLDPRVIAAGLAGGARVDAATAAAGAKAAAAQAKSEAANAQMSGSWQEVADLANELKNHGSLNANVGPIDRMIPTWRSGSVEFNSKAEQLKALLSLAARGKLKGQGAVSDMETRMLANSATALNSATDEAAYKAELDKIIGSAGERAKGSGATKRYNPKTGQIE